MLTFTRMSIKTMKLLSLFIFCLVLSVSSCKKDELTATATVVFTGDPAADGCGYLVKIDGTGTEYSPVNLSSDFAINNLKVNIRYQVLASKSACGNIAGGSNSGITQIRLDNIAKQ